MLTKAAIRVSLVALVVALIMGCVKKNARAEETKRYMVSFESWAGDSDRKRALKAAGAKSSELLDGVDAAVVEVDATRATAFAGAASLDPVFGMIEEDVYISNWLVDTLPSFYSTSLPGVRETLNQVKPLEADPNLAPQPGQPWADVAEFPWGIRRVNAQGAWGRTMGAGVKVAVIDTGIDANHPDLKGQVVDGYNAFDSKASWFDDQGHGSHVSGTIAGTLDSKGVVGVAPKARLYAVKVLDKNGGGKLSSIVKGILWAANNKMQVANMSLGAPIGSVFMKLAVKYAVAKGVVIVAAAGNSGGSVGYPGGYDESICVAASDNRDQIAKFSSRGSEVDFIAPGVDVKSSIMGGGWDEYSGTSMASPHVAGLAALAVGRGIPASRVRAEFKRAAKSIGLSPKEQGAGLIDAGVLVQ